MTLGAVQGSQIRVRFLAKVGVASSSLVSRSTVLFEGC